MRKTIAIATLGIVAGFTLLIGVSHFAYASVLYSQLLDDSGELPIHTPCSGSCPSPVSLVGSFVSPANFSYLQLSGSLFTNFYFRSVRFSPQDVVLAISTSSAVYVRPTDALCRLNSPLNSIGTSYTLASSSIGVQSSCNLVSGSTYYLHVYTYTSGGGGYVKADSVSLYGFLTTNLEVVLPDTSTRFISVVPVNGTTTATTTVFGASVYINESDYVEDMYLHVNFVNNTLQNGIGGSALDAWDSAFGGFDFPIVSAGLSVFSTTTVFTNIGDTYGYYSVHRPNSTWLIGSLLPPVDVIATSTKFTVVSKTGLDIAMSSTSDALISALLTGTTTIPVLSCNLSGFDLQNCLISLIIPNSQLLQSDYERLRHLAPWGYVLRFYDILVGTASSTLPVISYNFASSSPLSAIGTISFDPFGTVIETGNILNSAVSDQSVSKNVWDIMEYPIRIVIYLMLFFMILHDLTKINKHHKIK